MFPENVRPDFSVGGNAIKLAKTVDSFIKKEYYNS